MRVKPAILVVEDEADMLRGLCKMLARESYEVDGAGAGDEAIAKLDRKVYDVVITDLRLPGASGIDVLRHMRDLGHESVGIVITGYGSVESAVEAMKMGVFDYIAKPFDLQKVRIVVRNALDQSELVGQNRYLKKTVETAWQVDHIIGRSERMQGVLDAAAKVAPADTTVLLNGESGTGKELIARHIHHLSPRRDRLFTAVNCAVLREQFLESELFGHVKGAFTGAVMAKRGLLEVAHKGTFFMDEIADVSPPVQAKLLRVLEERSFMRLGGTEAVNVNIRLIAATNKDLETCVREGTFREDLYYRLNVFSLTAPPLRERREDISALAHYFLKKLGLELGKQLDGISPEALAALAAYDWPGNVRELRNAIERGIILAAGGMLTSSELPDKLSATGAPDTAVPATAYREAKRLLLEKFNRDFVTRTLAECDGVVTRAAERAGMNRANFQRLMRNAGIKSSES